MNKLIKRIQLFLLCVIMTTLTFAVVACADAIYNVSFDTQGGGTVSSQEVKEGELVNEPTNVSKTGYSLVGWYTSKDYETKWNFEKDTPKNDLALVAKWVANQYTISFDVNGGNEPINEIDVTYGQSFVLPVPEKSGFIFDGWYKGTQLVESGICNFTDNITLVAQWQENAFTQQDFAEALVEIKKIFEPESQVTLMAALRFEVTADLEETNLKMCPIANIVNALASIVSSNKYENMQENTVYKSETASMGTVFLLFEYNDGILKAIFGNYVDIQNDLYMNVGFEIEYDRVTKQTGDFEGGTSTRLSTTSDKGHTYYLYKKAENKLYTEKYSSENKTEYYEKIDVIIDSMVENISSAVDTGADYSDELAGM